MLSGCLSQTVSTEGAIDKLAEPTISGLYQAVYVNQSTGDTDKTDRRFYRFKTDGTFHLTLISLLPPYWAGADGDHDSSDTVWRFMPWWERRGNYKYTVDSIKYFNYEHRATDLNNKFLPWETDSANTYFVDISKVYKFFSRDLWITFPISNGSSGNGSTSDSSYIVYKRIGDETMEIPWSLFQVN